MAWHGMAWQQTGSLPWIVCAIKQCNAMDAMLTHPPMAPMVLACRGTQVCVVYLTQLSPSGGYPIRQQLRIAVNQAIMQDAPTPVVHEHGRSRL
jgi:hypothetical protein